jgi:hypothetical protein
MIGTASICQEFLTPYVNQEGRTRLITGFSIVALLMTRVFEIMGADLSIEFIDSNYVDLLSGSEFSNYRMIRHSLSI